MNNISIKKPEGVYEPIIKETSEVQTQAVKPAKEIIADKVELSSKAKEYIKVKKLALSAIEGADKATDPARIEQLKKDVNSGKYNISSEDIAQSIIYGPAKK